MDTGPVTNDPGRVSGYDGHVRHIMRHDGSGGYDSTPSNPRPGQDDGSHVKDGVISDRDRSEGGLVCGRINSMLSRDYGGKADVRVLSNDNSAPSINERLPDDSSRSDLDISIDMASSENRRRRGYSNPAPAESRVYARLLCVLYPEPHELKRIPQHISAEKRKAASSRCYLPHQ